jgi:hypothetical protein
MIRPRILFVSRSRRCAEALSSYCRALVPPYKALHAHDIAIFETPDELFERLSALDPAEAAETMVVYDACADQYRLWDAAGLGLGDRGIGVHLALGYPEVFFVFIEGNDLSFTPEVRLHHVVNLKDLSKLLYLISLHSSGFRVLYDPTGLRSILKESLVSADGISRNRYQPAWRLRIAQPACVIEDEMTFAHFNSYAAYRAGFRVYTATSYMELERLVPVSAQSHSTPDVCFHTVVADWDIHFVDFVPGDKIASLNLDARLRHSKARVFVVTSQKNAAIEGFLAGLPDLLIQGVFEGDSARAQAAEVRCVPKPYPGLFELVEMLKTDTTYTPEHSLDIALERHTAPNGANLIADNLMLRAKRMFDVSERDQLLLLQQAMILGEAKEILGGLSPTTFLEALSLQNAAEIRAEASYLGMSSEIEPSSRIRAFEEETANGVLTDAREVERTKTRLDYVIQQLTSFRRIYNEYEAVVAAEVCLRGIAERQKMQLRNDRSWLSRMKLLGMWYSDLVTKSGTSIARLLIADVIIVLGFFAIFAGFLALRHCEGAAHVLWLSLGHSVLSFMEVAPGLNDYEETVKCAVRVGAPGWVLFYRTVLFLEITLAYVNLGLLIAMLYRRVTRRVP